jgi:RNA polymerase sigma factor (TIGR02999 family)
MGEPGKLAPASTPAKDATLLMNAAGEGDAAAAGQLLELVYDQLRGAAQIAMNSERQGHTLSATVLVHEAFIKLAGPREIPWANRAHFYAAAAQAVRQILLDHARSRGRQKRGGGRARVNLDAGPALAAGVESESGPDYAALDAAIRRLGDKDPRAADVVRLRYYAGLTGEQTAQSLGISERTVKNDWAFAKAWLGRELAAGD